MGIWVSISAFVGHWHWLQLRQWNCAYARMEHLDIHRYAAHVRSSIDDIDTKWYLSLQHTHGNHIGLQ